MGFLDQVFNKDDKGKELKQELHSLKVRKESVVSAITAEISRLEGERTNVMVTAGTKAYDAWKEGQTQTDLTEYWSQIDNIKAQIEEQEQKKVQMEQQYDEEIRLISCNLNALTAAPAAAPAAAPVGAAPAGVSPAAQAGPAPVPMQAPTAAAAVCPSCGAPVGAGDKFCQKCGSRLQ